MSDNETVSTTPKPRRRAASRPAGPPQPSATEPVTVSSPLDDPPPAKATRKAPAKRAAAKTAVPAAATEPTPQPAAPVASAAAQTAPPAVTPLFQPPDPAKATPRRRTTKQAADSEPAPPSAGDDPTSTEPANLDLATADPASPDSATADPADGDDSPSRRRRRRGGRRRRKPGADQAGDGSDGDEQPPAAPAEAESSADAGTDGTAADSDGDSEDATGSRRRRRRRRRSGEDAEGSEDDPAETVVRVRKPREPRAPKDDITSITGSTRLEAKKQRRREGRDSGRRRPPIVSEAEFLARRESVRRSMVVRQREHLTQIAVLEDDVLVEHYVARDTETSLIGNVYLGRVQNVLPSMEAAFIDIGKGRNAVLYAGEVNWDLLVKDGGPRRIESALKSGQQVLVQVSKDPVGNKGARLTSQISLPGRYIVYVPSGQSSGISRKLADTERSRLKALLKKVLPDEAGVIIRTAAEGASEEELTRDVNRLTARWADITKKAETAAAPALLYGEPDLTVKVVRDLFTEDFAKLVVAGDDAWDIVDGYVRHVAPELSERVERWAGDGDVFAAYRVDEQIAKGLDRKVWLPSGGSLVIDRTEAMTVVDVNTGKFIGSGGNLEQTVTKNNLEAAEEVVRQLRLRDIGGIIVIDFIDMVLESNRDLVLRRLIECLSRDRTRHQVAEVTSLGLVQMTRKRIGIGLLEAFSQPCEHCGGRGLITSLEPVEPKPQREPERGRRRQPKPAGPAEAVPSETAPPEPARAEAAAADSTPPAEPPAESPREPEQSHSDPPPTTAQFGLLTPRHQLDDLPPATTPRKRVRKAAGKPA